jgi:exodeoxyribonuclease V alpha subunit
MARPAGPKELVGVVRRVQYRGDDGFVVAALDCGAAVVGEDPAGDLMPGVTFRFLGRWTRHPQYGEQFAFSTFTRHAPHDEAGVIRYLKQEAPHVGEVIARKLWERYGSDAVVVLRTRPAEVAAAGIMSAVHAGEAAAALEALAGMEATRIDLGALFDGRGFPRSLIQACIARWGSRAPERIRRDPFVLMTGGLSGCGFLRCDALYLALGHSPARLKRQALCCWQALREFGDRGGDTWFPVERVAQELRRKLRDAARPKDAAKLALRARWLARYRDRDGKLWLAEAEKAAAERRLAEAARGLLAWVPPAAPAGSGKTASADGPGLRRF